MDKFKKRSISKIDIPNTDKGVSVKSVLSLIEGHKYYDEFVTYLGVDSIIDEFITIPGAEKIVVALKAMKEKYVKFDIESDYKDLDFQYDKDDKSLNINYSNVKGVTFVDSNQSFDVKPFEAVPINSAQGDFFSGIYNMGKYASSLIAKDNADVVLQNLEILRGVFTTEKHLKSYRIIKDEDYYLRAITSPQYSDFNINISVAIVLITLHKNASTKATYAVGRCEYNQSSLKLYLEKLADQELEGIGKVKFLFELSNDEIKEDPLKVSIGFSITYKNEAGDDTAIYIKPQDYKSTVISIAHRGAPKAAVKQLLNIKNLAEIENDLIKDVIAIKKIKDVEQIKFILKSRIEKLKANPLTQHRDSIVKACEDKVQNIHDLLVLMHKIDIIAEDIESKEYLRYIMYDVLVDRKKK